MEEMVTNNNEEEEIVTEEDEQNVETLEHNLDLLNEAALALLKNLRIVLQEMGDEVGKEETGVLQ